MYIISRNVDCLDLGGEGRASRDGPARAAANFTHTDDITWPLNYQHQSPGEGVSLPYDGTSTIAVMPSLLLVVFTLQFVLHLINTVGVSTVDELVRTSSHS